MNSAEFSRFESACEANYETAEGCPSMCGMCASCVFAPKQPGFTVCLWRVSDEFKRRFIVELILRCRNVQVLESIHNALSVTSWSLFTYARSRSPASPQDYPCRSANRALDGKPLGMDANKIWDWFSSSPGWIQSRYLCRILSRCEHELLRTVFNLTSVLLVRHKRRFLQFNSSPCSHNQHDEDYDEDSEHPALMVVPGASKSVSGVSRYRDFISCLPVDLSKKILGLLDEHTLRRCQKVCRYWHHLAKETMEELKLRIQFQDQITAMMMMCKATHVVSPTYANIVEVLIPTKEHEAVDIHLAVQKDMPFEAAYAKINTKTVRMEERNVYCGAYFTKVLLNKEDSHRVVDYRGSTLMAMGSKDRVVQLFYVASETKVVSVMKGHIASIRAVLLCEDRNLVISASSDTNIRCWNLKTDRCDMELYGHTGSVNCLDVHAHRLVSGAKDCLVKVWNLNTGKHFEGFNFKHPASVLCVKISATKVYSSCDRGLVKIWDMEKASLERMIDAHRSSVKCLFLDEWHLLSGDLNGQVMAWSTSCHAKECLITFNHPKEVKSLTLIYLRVVTGCMDGIIRIFNFLTGDCLRDITAETESGRLLSLHFGENNILVNTTSTVTLYQFAKVFWDYTDSTERGQGDVLAKSDSVSKKYGASNRKLSFTYLGADHMAQVASPYQMMRDYKNKQPEGAELLHPTRFLFTCTKCQKQPGDRYETDKQSLMLSEKATSEKIKKRGLHHPLTRDSILLRVNAIQRAQCKDEVSINMECNTRLRDSWGPHTPQDPLPSDLQSLQICPLCHSHDDHHRRAKTCVPILKTTSSLARSASRGRDVTTAPNTMRRHHHCLCSKKGQPLNAATNRSITRVGTSAKDRLQASEIMLTRSISNPANCIKRSTSLPMINTSGPNRTSKGDSGWSHQFS